MNILEITYLLPLFDDEKSSKSGKKDVIFQKRENWSIFRKIKSFQQVFDNIASSKSGTRDIIFQKSDDRSIFRKMKYFPQVFDDIVSSKSGKKDVNFLYELFNRSFFEIRDFKIRVREASNQRK